MITASASLKSPRVSLLHLIPMLALRLIIPKSHLLEKHIAGIEHSARISCTSTLLAEKVIQYFRLDLSAICMCLRDLAQEADLCDLGLRKVGGDLLSDFVAGIVDGDGNICFAVEVNGRNVVLLCFLFLL